MHSFQLKTENLVLVDYFLHYFCNMSLRTQRNFSIDNATVFKQKLFAWAQQFETIVWLDSNNYEQKYSSFDAVIAIDEFTAIKTDYQNALEALKEYQTYTKDYLFGYIGIGTKSIIHFYDLLQDVVWNYCIRLRKRIHSTPCSFIIVGTTP